MIPNATTDLPPADRPCPLVTRTYGDPQFHTDGDVAALTFAADGTVWSVDDAGVLRHWAADGSCLRRTYLSDLETLWAFAPNASLLASGNDDLLVWDVADGQLRRRLDQPAWVTAVGFSADGKVLASGHDDGSVRLWDTKSLKLLGEISDAHAGPVSAISFRPTGGAVATAGEDRLVKVFDDRTYQAIGTFASHTDRIPALAWAADGSLLVSAGWDTSARVWQLGTDDPLILLNSHADQVLAAAFAPVGNTLATADSDHDIYLWADPAAGKVGKVLRGHTDEVRCLAFSPDGSKVASAGADRVIHIWDAATGALVAGPNPKAKHGLVSFVHPQTSAVAVASTAGPDVRVWDVASGRPLPPTGTGSAYSVAVSADGKTLAVGGTDHFTTIHHLSARTSRKLEATKPPIGAVAVSKDGSLVAHTSPADGLVWLWNPAVAEAELILIEAADGCTLETVAIHPDGIRIAAGGVDYLSTGDRDGAVCVWDRTTGQKVLTFDNGVYAVAFDPSGKYLAGAGLADKVYLWDVDAGQMVFELDGHQERINAVAFDPSGSYLVTGGDDMTVRVWDVLSGRLVVMREFDTPIQAVAFSPCGTYLFTGNGNTTVYKTEFQHLLDD